MRIVTGDECGLLKECIPELSRPKKLQTESFKSKSNELERFSTQDGVRRIDSKETQTRSRGIADLAFTSPDKDSFAALRVNGTVELWRESHASKESFGTYQRMGKQDAVFQQQDNKDGNEVGGTDAQSQMMMGRPMALECLLDRQRLCASNTIGDITVLKAESGSILARYSAFASVKKSNTISYTKGQYINQNIATAMALDNGNGRLAVSGRERETIMLDLETGATVWKAKNLPPDPQTLLQQPIWTTALLFLDSNAYFQGSQNLLAAGTAYHQVRLYDVRTDSAVRRPLAYTPEGLLSHRVTALCQLDAHTLAVGDAAGFLYAMDLRTSLTNNPSRNLGRFVGPSGSIRQVAKHETLPILAVVGLDRMLRTYHVSKRKELDCVYLKQRLNCLLFASDLTWTERDSSQDLTRDLDDYDIDVEDQVQDYVDSDDDASEVSDAVRGSGETSASSSDSQGSESDKLSKGDSSSSSSNEDHDDEVAAGSDSDSDDESDSDSAGIPPSASHAKRRRTS